MDDCNGWSGAYPGDAVADAFRAFVAGGGHASFTDIALKDMEVLFPGHVSLFRARIGKQQKTALRENAGKFAYGLPVIRHMFDDMRAQNDVIGPVRTIDRLEYALTRP